MRSAIAFIVCMTACLACVVAARAQEGFVYNDHGKPDPFIPWVTADGRLQVLVAQERKNDDELKIEGIIYDTRALSFAIINGEVVKVGDRIQGYQVLKIEENKVIVIKEGQPKEILLPEEGL